TFWPPAGSASGASPTWTRPSAKPTWRSRGGTCALAKNLLKLLPALWTFAEVPTSSRPTAPPSSTASSPSAAAPKAAKARSTGCSPSTRPAGCNAARGCWPALHDVDDWEAGIGVEAGGGEERGADIAGEERVAASAIRGRHPLCLGERVDGEA